jgi:ferric-dicitrate binding protein FerR (iron transport regulator)
MNTNDYQNFEDFILDESFREYVTATSETSVAFWKSWLISHPDKENEVRKASQILTTLLNSRKLGVPVDKNESLKELLNRIESDSKVTASRIINIPSWMKVAAVLLLSLGCGWLWNWANDNLFRNERLSAYNEVIVPIGEKSQIVLSDGTHVWINSGSKFKYPVSFGKKNRDVYLSGEAFFDVSHRDNQSFVVNTRDARVKVLGTAFNVKAYPEDAKTQTTVVRGLVSVQDIKHGDKEVLIRPNQMAVIQKYENKISTRPKEDEDHLEVLGNINVEAVTCWKNQLLVFVDEPLEDMAMKMERWFNVQILIEDSTLRKERYNGKFVNNETIYEVLEAIKQTTPIKYSVENNKIYIGRK